MIIIWKKTKSKNVNECKTKSGEGFIVEKTTEKQRVVCFCFCFSATFLFIKFIYNVSNSRSSCYYINVELSNESMGAWARQIENKFMKTMQNERFKGNSCRLGAAKESLRRKPGRKLLRAAGRLSLCGETI